jgi:hypothetical protein
MDGRTSGGLSSSRGPIEVRAGRGRNLPADGKITTHIRITVDLNRAAQMLERRCNGGLRRNAVMRLHSHR